MEEISAIWNIARSEGDSVQAIAMEVMLRKSPPPLRGREFVRL